MSQPLTEIRARLRAADRALAEVHGGSSELAHVRVATGSLLVALCGLVDLWEKREPSAGGLDVVGPLAKPGRARSARR